MGGITRGLGLSSRGSGAGRAAKAQQAASEAGIEEQRRQFDVTQRQLEPFREAGVGALTQQQALLGLSGPEAQQQAFSQFQQSPGQQFLRDRQTQALLRNEAAIGGLGGGNVRGQLQQQAAGFAQQDFQNQLAQLSALSGRGQQIGGQLGQFGAQTSSNIANLLGQGGQARASGILGQRQAQSQGLQNLVGLGAAFI